MDSEHRHELQQNELAAWLAGVVEKLKPYGSLIAISVVGLVLVYTAWGFYQNSSANKDAADWDLYTTAMLSQAPDLAALQAAADEFGDSGSVADWSSITLADGRLYAASLGWLLDRVKAAEALGQAREQYERLVVTKDVSPVVRHRAQLGLARSYELEGNVPQAIEAYEQVQGAFKQLAEDRIAALSEPEAQSDFEWLLTAQSPAIRAPLGPGIPGMQPEFTPDALDALLEEPMEEAASDDQTLDDILQGYEEKQATGVTQEATTADKTTEEAPGQADPAKASSQQDPPAAKTQVDANKAEKTNNQ